MPKDRTILTAKQQILITLTYRKLSESPSEIEKILGFKSSQIKRELQESNGLITEGLVEKDSKGFLRLTEKGKRDPVVTIIRKTRFLGKLILFLSIFLILHLWIGININFVNNLYYIFFQAMTSLIFFLIGYYMYLYPKLLLDETRFKAGSNDQDK